jgi:hypothetical protein
MAWRIVKQPNGLYARFSDPVDHFTEYDMQRDEALWTCRNEYGCSVEEALKKVENADNDRTQDGKIGRFQACVETIRIIHGEKEAEKVIQQMS